MLLTLPNTQKHYVGMDHCSDDSWPNLSQHNHSLGDWNIFCFHKFLSITCTLCGKTSLENMGIWHGPLKMYIFYCRIWQKKESGPFASGPFLPDHLQPDLSYPGPFVAGPFVADRFVGVPSPKSYATHPTSELRHTLLWATQHPTNELRYTL